MVGRRLVQELLRKIYWDEGFGLPMKAMVFSRSLILVVCSVFNCHCCRYDGCCQKQVSYEFVYVPVPVPLLLPTSISVPYLLRDAVSFNVQVM